MSAETAGLPGVARVSERESGPDLVGSASSRGAPAHDTFAFVLQLASAAPTSEETLRAACAASPLWSRVAYYAWFEGELAYLRSDLPSDEEPAAAVAQWLKLLGSASPGPVRPRALYVRQPDSAGLGASLGCVVRSSQPWFGLSFERSLLQRANEGVDTRLFQVLAGYTEERLCLFGLVQATAHELHQALRRMPDLASATPALLAGALGLSVRVLHQRLRAEGSSYRRVLDQLRLQRCLARVRSGVVSAHELSRGLGLPDETTFQRAFMRWTGCTVGGYVRRHVAWTGHSGGPLDQRRA